jgi:hypothetical protein
MAKRSDSTTRINIGEDWNWDRDETDLIKHNSLLLNVATSGSIAFDQPSLHVNNGVQSLTQFESIKDLFDRDGVMSIDCPDVSAAMKMRRKRLPKGSILNHVHNMGDGRSRQNRAVSPRVW